METIRFNELSLNDKAFLLYEFGELVMSIEYYHHRIYLYSLNSMLIEIFEIIETRQIEKIETASYKALDKYLSRILIWKSGILNP